MYKLAALAGTFDHLHKGHGFFISEAFKLGEKVIIGLTSDVYVGRKMKRLRHLGGDRMGSPEVEEFEIRKKELTDFLKTNGYYSRAKIVKIDDLYGPAIKNNEIEALVVTGETLKGGRLVNKKRRELGLNPLKILQVPQVMAEDRRRIASTRIRLGEIDRWGRVFRYKFKVEGKIREELKKPLGRLLQGNPKEPSFLEPEIKKCIGQKSPVMLITVGDEVTKLCNEFRIVPQLCIIDFKVARKKVYSSLEDLYILNFRGREKIVYNPAGYITTRLVKAVEKAIRRYLITGKQEIIRVIGEEDLAGVPAVLLASLGSLVLYGQPGEGIVAVEVTEEKKTRDT